MNYYLCGWRVRSDLSLPDLPGWSVSSDGLPDLRIRSGSVPASIDPLAFDTPIVHLSNRGECRVTVPGVATYVISPTGEDVVIAAASGAPPATVRLFLLTVVLGLVCHQRRLLPLHASCVRIGTDVVAFVAPSGFGKSTMAAALVQRGHTLIADDVTAIDPDPPGGPIVWPAFPHVKVWRDALGALGLWSETLDRDRAEIERYRVPTGAFDQAPQRLSAVYLLEWVLHARWTRIVPVTGFDAIGRLRRAVYRDQVGGARFGESAMFSKVGRLGSAVPVYALHQQHGLEFLGKNVDAVLKRHAG